MPERTLSDRDAFEERHAASAHAVKVVGKENHRSDVQQPGTQLVVDRGVQKNEIWFPVA